MEAASTGIPVIVLFLTSLLKKGFGDKDLFKRVLPILPVLLSFGLTFVPGLGLVSTPILTKIMFSLGAGGAAGTGYEVYKKTILGKRKI